jgi:WD40 repeat protein
LLLAQIGWCQAPELLVRTGHAQAIQALTISRDGKLLASADRGGGVVVWDAATGLELRNFQIDGGPVRGLAFDPGARLLAVGSDTMRVWDIRQWREVLSAPGGDAPLFDDKGVLRWSGPSLDAQHVWHPSGQLSAQPGYFSPTGRWRLTRSNDLAGIFRGRYELTETAGAKKRRIESVMSLAPAFGAADGIVAASGQDGGVQIYDLESGRKLARLPVASTVARVAMPQSTVISPDGRMVVITSGGLPTGRPDSTLIQVYDTSNGRELLRLGGHRAPVTCVSFSSDSRVLASGSLDTTVKLWDLASGKELNTFSGQDQGVQQLSFTADGQWLTMISGRRTVLWGLGRAAGIYGASAMRDEKLIGGAALAGGWHVVATGSDRVVVRDVLTGRDAGSLPVRPEREFSSAALSSDGHFVALVDAYPLQFGMPAFSPEAWRRLSRTPLPMQGRRNEPPEPPEDPLPVSGFHTEPSFDAPRHWLGKAYLGVFDLRNGREVHSADDVRTALFSPGGHYLAYSDWLNVFVFEPRTGKLRTFASVSGGKRVDAFRSIAFSGNGRWLAGIGTSLVIWDIETGKRHADVRMPPQPAEKPQFLTALGVAADGRHAAWCTTGPACEIADVKTAEIVRTFKVPGVVTSIEFSPDGQWLITGGSDGRVQLRDTERAGNPLATLIAPASTSEWLVVTPEGLFDGPAGAWPGVAWRFSPKFDDVGPVEMFFNEYFYPGLLGEILAGSKPPLPPAIAQVDRRQPELRLSAPAPAGRLVRIRIEVKDTGAGARDVRLLRNGSLVRSWTGAAAPVIELETKLVAGENVFTAWAFNRDNVKSRDAQLVVRGDESLKRAPVAHVLAIGINRYTNSDFNLKYAAADAQAFAAEFRRAQAPLGRFADVRVTALQDENATRVKILQALEKLAAQVEPEDAVLLYFGGHGIAREQRYYLIPHDLKYDGPRRSLVRPEALDQVVSHAISDEDLDRALERVEAAQILLVIDACEAGQALEGSEWRRGPMNSRGLAQLAWEKGMYILAGSQAYQSALEARAGGRWA